MRVFDLLTKLLLERLILLQTYAMQQVLAKFGILQVARTGKISLKRGEELLEMGGWGDGRRKTHSQRTASEKAGSSGSNSQSNGAVLEEQQEGGSDVYAVDNKQTGELHAAFGGASILAVNMILCHNRACLSP